MTRLLRTPLLAAAALLAASTAALAQRPVCVEFGPPPPAGTSYGAPAQHPGFVVPVAPAVIVTRLVPFAEPNHTTAFNRLRLEFPPPRPFGQGQTARFNNIAARFDFTHLVFTPNLVQFEFLDLGGASNLSVNGSLPWIGHLAAAPAHIAGTSVHVTATPVPGGVTGMVRITGPVIKDVVVGGQELWIDRVCASRG